MDRRGAFDYILLETSGVADPGNIAPLFWVDDGLGSTIYLDGVVTVVDAKNIVKSLDDLPEASAVAEETGSHTAHDSTLTTAHVQISHADIIILNKVDTVSPEDLALVKKRIQSINSLAKIEVTEFGQVPRLEGVILDLHAYDAVDRIHTVKPSHHHLDPVCTGRLIERREVIADICPKGYRDCDV